MSTNVSHVGGEVTSDLNVNSAADRES